MGGDAFKEVPNWPARLLDMLSQLDILLTL